MSEGRNRVAELEAMLYDAMEEIERLRAELRVLRDRQRDAAARGIR